MDQRRHLRCNFRIGTNTMVEDQGQYEPEDY